MVETPDSEKTPREAVRCKRRFLWSAARILVLLSSWCMGNLAPAETESFLCYLVPAFRFSDCRTHGSRHPVERATMASQTREFPDSKERFDRVNEARKTLATISAFE